MNKSDMRNLTKLPTLKIRILFFFTIGNKGDFIHPLNHPKSVRLKLNQLAEFRVGCMFCQLWSEEGNSSRGESSRFKVISRTILALAFILKGFYLCFQKLQGVHHWWLLIAIFNGGGGTFPDLPEEAGNTHVAIQSGFVNKTIEMAQNE